MIRRGQWSPTALTALLPYPLYRGLDLGACLRRLQTGGALERTGTNFSRSGGWMPEIKSPADSESAENPLPDSWTVFSYCHLTRWNGQGGIVGSVL